MSETTFEIPKELKEKYGIETIEQLDETFNKAKSVETLSNEWQQKEKTYTEKIAAAEQVNQRLGIYETSPLLKELANVATATPDKLETYLTIRSAKSDTALDAYKLRMQLEKGWSAEDVEDELTAQFGKVDDMWEDEEKKKYYQRIERNLAEHKDWLKEQKEKLVNVAPQFTVPKEMDDQEVEDVFVEAIKPIHEHKNFFVVPKEHKLVTAEELKEAGLDEDIDTSFEFAIPLDEERKKEIDEITKLLIKKNNLKKNPENLELIKNMVILASQGKYYNSDLEKALKVNTLEVWKKAKDFFEKKGSVATERRSPVTKTDAPTYIATSDTTEPKKFVTPNKK